MISLICGILKNKENQTNTKKQKQNKNKKPPWTGRYREQIGGYQMQEMGKMGEGGQNIKISSYKINKSWGTGLVTIVNNTVFYIWKVAKRVDLKSSHYKKKTVTMCGDDC